jgi:hypothetical protein
MWGAMGVFRRKGGLSLSVAVAGRTVAYPLYRVE